MKCLTSNKIICLFQIPPTVVKNIDEIKLKFKIKHGELYSLRAFTIHASNHYNVITRSLQYPDQWFVYDNKKKERTEFKGNKSFHVATMMYVRSVNGELEAMTHLRNSFYTSHEEKTWTLSFTSLLIHSIAAATLLFPTTYGKYVKGDMKDEPLFFEAIQTADG